MAVDNRTQWLNLPLPDAANKLSDDVLRLVSSLNTIDEQIHAINLILASNDVSYDTVQEIVDRLKNTDVAGVAKAEAIKMAIALG